MLERGVYEAAAACLTLYGRHYFDTLEEEGGSSKVNFVLLVDGHKSALCEAKSPSVMHNVGEALPEHGIGLTWHRGQSLIPKIFTKVGTPFLTATSFLRRYV